jgi:hypothetical protein
MHLKRRPGPSLHAPRSLREIRPRRQRIRPQHLVNQRERNFVRNHARKYLGDAAQISPCHRALPESPRMIRAGAQVGQDLGLHVVERHVPVLMRGSAHGQTIQEEDDGGGRVDAEGSVGLGFLVC